MSGTGNDTASDAGRLGPEAALAHAFARDGIPYPVDRLADAMAEYADLRRFMGLIRAADREAVADDGRDLLGLQGRT